MAFANHSRDIGAEVAAAEHVRDGLERHTTLPVSELQKDIDVLKIEESLAKNLDEVSQPLVGAIRAAKLLGLTGVVDLEEAALLIGGVLAEMARDRGDQ